MNSYNISVARIGGSSVHIYKIENPSARISRVKDCNIQVGKLGGTVLQISNVPPIKRDSNISATRIGGFRINIISLENLPAKISIIKDSNIQVERLEEIFQTPLLPSIIKDAAISFTRVGGSFIYTTLVGGHSVHTFIIKDMDIQVERLDGMVLHVSQILSTSSIFNFLEVIEGTLLDITGNKFTVK